MRKVKSILGELAITEKQAKKLDIKSRTQMSPMLEKNCLLLSGDESYEKSAQKIKSLTGIAVSHSTQQRQLIKHTAQPMKLPFVKYQGTGNAGVLRVGAHGGRHR